MADKTNATALHLDTTSGAILPESAARPTWGRRETFFALWVVAGLVALYPVAAHLQASFPIFTVVWLGVPLLAVLRGRDAGRAGFRPVAGRLLGPVAALNLGLLLLVMLLFEPWSGAYGSLVGEALESDPTFAWLTRYDAPAGWLLMWLFSAVVTIFGEELFFRGWLLQGLLRRTGRWRAILLQAALFSLPQALPALVLSPVQAAIWIGAYAFLAVGVVNGWAAARTGSIWPGVIAAPLMNVAVTLLSLS
ncbi:MAG: CPBP family intramembrane metalloprotease [Chloroflexi bacterium]|nr:CPBP family intramembrane metalloprotease [Chloroflexota bacterium]